jgi:hypothetical protein
LSYSLIAVLVSTGILYGMSPSEFGFFQNNNSFAQESNTTIGNSGSGLDTTTRTTTTAAASAAVQFNTYENNELGLSLKYPSSFLIDESNLNLTLRQVSFFPVYNISAYPERYIQWMDVFVQPLNASQYALSASLPNTTTTQSDNVGIEAFMENLANDILQQNEDVTILNASADALLSGQPAYKVITRSYFENSTIDEVQVGTIVDNTLYSLNFEVESSNYTKSLPVIDAITESFKIKTASTIVEEILDLGPADTADTATAPTSATDAFPLLMDRVLSSLKSDLRIDEITNNSRELKNLENSINSLLANSKNGVNQSQSTVTSVEEGFRDLLSSLNLPDNATQRLDTSEFNNLIGSLRSFSNSTGLSNSPAVISSLLSNLLSSPSSPSPSSNAAENPTNNNGNIGDYLNFNRTETESVVKQYLNNGTKEVLRMFDFLNSR